MATLSHGPALVIDFENSIRRSRTETARYEFKQGLLRLDETKMRDPTIMQVIVETICGIALGAGGASVTLEKRVSRLEVAIPPLV